MKKSYIEYFFKPNSIAVIGASREPRKFGHVIFKNFADSDFKGELYPINPKAKEILGRKAYRDVMDVPDEIDLVVLAIPAPLVPKVMETCGKKSVKAAIIISGGFGETGEKGKKIEDQLKKTIIDYGVRTIGPNCIGVFDPINHIDTLFLPRYRLRRPKRGPIAFISQSGAFGSAILDWAASHEIGISKFVSIGNKIDVDEIDLLKFLEGDQETSCVTLYLEGITRGREFMDVSSRVTKKKPIVALKGGVTEEGKVAVHSHTGSLAGSAEIYSAAFKQSGVIQAHSVSDLFDFARALAYHRPPRGEMGVAVITNGGGFGVITTDKLVQNHLKLAEFKKRTLKDLEKRLPEYAIIRNPLDLVGDADVERYRVALNSIAKDKNIGMMIVIILLQTSFLESDVVDAITEAQTTYGKPIIVCTVGGDFTEILVSMLEENGIPTYPTPERVVKSASALIEYGRHIS